MSSKGTRRRSRTSSSSSSRSFFLTSPSPVQMHLESLLEELGGFSGGGSGAPATHPNHRLRGRWGAGSPPTPATVGGGETNICANRVSRPPRLVPDHAHTS